MELKISMKYIKGQVFIHLSKGNFSSTIKMRSLQFIAPALAGAGIHIKMDEEITLADLHKRINEAIPK